MASSIMRRCSRRPSGGPRRADLRFAPAEKAPAAQLGLIPTARRAAIVLATLSGCRSTSSPGGFRRAVRRRGAAYQRAGLVTIKQSSPTSIRAVATGTEDYDVRIEVDDRTLVLSCSCPAFDNDGPCKHLWATALVAAERRMLAAMPSSDQGQARRARRARRRRSTTRSLDDDDDDDDTTKWSRRFRPASSCASPRISAALALTRRGRAAAHRGPGPRSGRPCSSPAGAAIRRSGRRPCRRRPRRFSTSSKWTRPASSGELTVSLRTRAARKKGGFAKDKAAAVPVEALELLPDARDRRALPLLQAAATLTGSAASGYQSVRLRTVRRTSVGSRPRRAIPTAMADELMPLLAETGRLFMRREPKARAGARDVRRQSALGVRPRALPRRRGSGRARSPGCSSGAPRAFPCPRPCW